jgi:hypothetical protein
MPRLAMAETPDKLYNAAVYNAARTRVTSESYCQGWTRRQRLNHYKADTLAAERDHWGTVTSVSRLALLSVEASERLMRIQFQRQLRDVEIQVPVPSDEMETDS